MNILFIDDYLIVCEKPAGVLSEYDDKRANMPTLLAAELNGAPVTVLNRLDREVGGVMVLGLHPLATAQINKQISERTFKKEYFAVVEGVPGQKEGTLTDLLFHDKGKNKSYVAKRQRNGVKQAVLDFAVVDSVVQDGCEFSLIKITLKTGRTHQIRVQFSSRGTPLVGDKKYGSKFGGNLALWSHKVGFIHPRTKEATEFALPLPQVPPYTWFEFVKSGKTESVCDLG